MNVDRYKTTILLMMRDNIVGDGNHTHISWYTTDYGNGNVRYIIMTIVVYFMA